MDNVSLRLRRLAGRSAAVCASTAAIYLLHINDQHTAHLFDGCDDRAVNERVYLIVVVHRGLHALTDFQIQRFRELCTAPHDKLQLQADDVRVPSEKVEGTPFPA